MLDGANLIIQQCIVDRTPIKVLLYAIRFEHFILEENRELLLKVLCIFIGEQLCHRSAVKRQYADHVTTIEFEE